MSEYAFSSTQDIINSADSWNLAKDIGLLHHLEKFSEELIGNANTTNEKLNSLFAELNKTHIKFDVIQNRFQSLHNTQFIESRVYEDDETLQSQEGIRKDESQSLSENDKLKTMKNVILKGMEVIDKYYEKVEVPGSDSEDEVDFPRFTLRPKDPYSDRPLPYVIGTEEWHKKWHVGLLEETSSESEDEKISNKLSSSDSEDTLPIYNRPQILGTSETSSEIEFNKSEICLPTTSDDVKKGSDVTAEESDTNSFSSQAPIANSTFADQLAAKLGNVFDHNRNIEEPVVNTRPIQKVPVPFKYRNMFPEEPPPLDNLDNDDLFNSGKVKSNDLFDDLDDDNSLWSNDPVTAKSSDKNNKNNNEELQNKVVDEFKKRNFNNNNNKKVLDLFDENDDDDDDDDIFNTNPVIKSKKPFLIEQKKTKTPVPLFRGEPPDISVKKPFGGGSSSLSPPIKNENLFNEGIETEKENIFDSSKTETNKKLKETIDIFNDNANDLFDDDLFSNTAETNKFTSNLFSSISDDVSPIKEYQKENVTIPAPTPASAPALSLDSKSARLLSSDVETEKELIFEKSVTSKTGLSLFDDVNDDFDDLFSQDESKSNNGDRNNKNNESKDGTIRNDKLIFNDIWPVEINKNNYNEDESDGNKRNENDLEKSVPNKPFDDDLVDEHVNVNVIEKEPDIKESATSSNSNVNDTTPKNNLFSNTPPELNDDDWDVTSDNNLFEDMFEKMPEIQPYKLGLFMSDEPPSLFSSSNDDDNYLRAMFEDVSEKTSEARNKSEIIENTSKPPHYSGGGIVDNLDSEVKMERNVSSPATSPQKLPGKLKHSLNINVNALLPPGANKPKSKTLINVLENVSTTTPKSIENSNQEHDEEKQLLLFHTPRGNSSFGDEIDAIKTLDSVTKSRVRAPVQRRPSSRKARQQFLRNTDSNYIVNLPDTNKISPDSTEFAGGDGNVVKVESEKIETRKETIEKKIAKQRKETTERLFDSSDSESDSELFFSSRNNISKSKINEKRKLESDIFKISTTSIKNKTEKSSVESKNKLHEDLFGDDMDDDDDDLFSVSKPKSSEETKQSSSGAKIKLKGSIKSTIKKLDNEAKPVLDDPLNLLRDG